MTDLARLDRQARLQLTVTGRKTGIPRTVTIWFAVENNKIYVTSGRGADSQWIKNLRKTPTVTLQVGDTQLTGRAVWREDEAVRTQIFPLFYRKYFLARVFRWVGWYKQGFAFEIIPSQAE